MPNEPLSRRPSRMTAALTHVRSIDAHPPHHHHPEESDHHGDDTADHTRPVPASTPKPVVDIEHVPVDDDPREWSNLKKNLVLTMMTISVVSCSLRGDRVRTATDSMHSWDHLSIRVSTTP